MKIIKGNIGYIKAQKKKRLARVLISAAFIITLLVSGYLINGTKINILTIVAVLACLPFAKMLISLIMVVPYHSLTPEMEKDIYDRTECLTMLYETILTSREKVMPVDVIAISSHTICAYSQYEKTDLEYTSDYLKKLLQRNGFNKVSVKLFSDYTAFYTRAEGMNNIARIDRPDTKAQEERMKQLLLSISL